MSKTKTTLGDLSRWFIRWALRNGMLIGCGICHQPLSEDDKIQWHHMHNEAMGGPHELDNLTPTHARCNLKKAGDESRALHKIDRITGKTKGRPKRKIRSRPFTKSKRKMQSRPWGRKAPA